MGQRITATCDKPGTLSIQVSKIMESNESVYQFEKKLKYAKLRDISQPAEKEDEQTSFIDIDNDTEDDMEKLQGKIMELSAVLEVLKENGQLDTWIVGMSKNFTTCSKRLTAG